MSIQFNIRNLANNHQPSTYEWSKESAFRKLKSDISLSVGVGLISLSKPITNSHNPEKDAYRACNKCGKHINFHKDGKCQ